MSKNLVTLQRVCVDAFTHSHPTTIQGFLQGLVGRTQGKPRRLLHHIDLRIQPGNILGLLGPNGSGKSTLCKVIAGAIAPSSGEISLHCQPRGLMGSSFRTTEDLTGWENALSLASLFFPSEAPGPIAKEAVEFAQLWKFRHQTLRTFSVGMRKRLILSVVSARPAPLLILDEVFGGADASFQGRIARRFTRAVRRSGATVIVSHNTGLLQKLCNRVFVLDRGKIVFRGKADDAIAHYQSRFPPPPKNSVLWANLPK